MRIRMLTCLSGVDFVLNKGDETERLEDADCVRLILAGFAVPVADPMERAVCAAPERRNPFLELPVTKIKTLAADRTREQLRADLLDEQRGKARKSVIAAIEQQIG